MSQSNIDKPFYVDVGTSIAAVRCQSNRDVLYRFDHVSIGKAGIEMANNMCDRMNAEVDTFIADQDGEIENLKKENASLRVINCGNYYADEQLRGELAMKDAEIEKLKFDNMRLKSEQRTASEIEYRRICASRLSLANEENSHGIQ